MFKKLFPYMRKYGKYMILGPVTVIFEVLIEIQIPVLMSKIVDVGIPAQDMAYVLRTGALMIAMALISLFFGAVSSQFSSTASMGFGSELRGAMFDKVQQFSFANMDKFSTASLVTRLTTDVTNVQNAFLMTIRILVRAPVMLVSATFMAFSINHSLVSDFLVAIPSWPYSLP